MFGRTIRVPVTITSPVSAFSCLASILSVDAATPVTAGASLFAPSAAPPDATYADATPTQANVINDAPTPHFILDDFNIGSIPPVFVLPASQP